MPRLHLAAVFSLAIAPIVAWGAEPPPADVVRALAFPPSARVETAATAQAGSLRLWAGEIPTPGQAGAVTRIAALLTGQPARVVTRLRIELGKDDSPSTTAVFGAARPLRVDGREALLLELGSLYADREATSFLLFLPDGRVLTPPDPSAALRPMLRKGEAPFVDEQAAVIGNVPIRIVLAPSPGGLGWLTPADGVLRLWVSVPVTGSEGWMARHRMAVAVYRVDRGGIIPDGTWNGGRPWVSPRPADPATFDPERIAREGPPR